MANIGLGKQKEKQPTITDEEIVSLVYLKFEYEGKNI
jgi:hypothetical protein